MNKCEEHMGEQDNPVEHKNDPCHIDQMDDLIMIMETVRKCVYCESDTCPVKEIIAVY